MTASLAGFIDSPDGDIYANVCAHYGLNPGHAFTDDVVAFQVDLGFMFKDGLATREPTFEEKYA